MENILSGNPLLNYSAAGQKNDLKVRYFDTTDSKELLDYYYEKMGKYILGLVGFIRIIRINATMPAASPYGLLLIYPARTMQISRIKSCLCANPDFNLPLCIHTCSETKKKTSNTLTVPLIMFVG